MIAEVPKEFGEGITAGSEMKEDYAGWYYVNSTSVWEANYENEEIQTGKSYKGVRWKNLNESKSPGEGEPDLKLKELLEQEKLSQGDFDESDNSPSLFYIKEEESGEYGLYCIFNATSNFYQCSPVWEREDDTQIKVF